MLTGGGLKPPVAKLPPEPKPPDVLPIAPKPEVEDADNEPKPEAANALVEVWGGSADGDFERANEAKGDATDVLAKPLVGGTLAVDASSVVILVDDVAPSAPVASFEPGISVASVPFASLDDCSRLRLDFGLVISSTAASPRLSPVCSGVSGRSAAGAFG